VTGGPRVHGERPPAGQRSLGSLDGSNDLPRGVVEPGRTELTATGLTKPPPGTDDKVQLTPREWEIASRPAVLSVVRICRLRGRSELSSAVILTAVGFVYTSVARLGARAEPARSIIKFNPTRDSV
jgi:hypothetical protein